MLTKRQKENIAKYLFDLSKISFAVPVIGTVVSKEPFAFATFWGGIFFYHYNLSFSCDFR